MRKGVFIFFLFPALLWAQDIHFTQWMHNALFSNPAQSGFFEGTYRIHAQQRSQWASVSRPYTTTSLGMDMLVKNIGLGGQLLLDKAGTSRLRNTQFTVSGAYEMAGWRGGLQLGFVNRGIDYSDLQFPDQNESIPSESKSYVDLGLGVLKSLQLTQDKVVQLGLAMHHLNRPNTSFSNFKDPLPMRHQVQAQMQWELSEYWELLPSLRYQQQSSSREMQWGTHLALDLSDYYQKEIE
jgi:type IX secretion system PorP/SprF family membrane protein